MNLFDILKASKLRKGNSGGGSGGANGDSKPYYFGTYTVVTE